MVRRDIGLLLGSRHPDPDGTDPRISRAGNIPLQAVAHHERLFGRHSELSQQTVKDLGIRLPDAVLPRDGDRMKEGSQTGSGDFLTL